MAEKSNGCTARKVEDGHTWHHMEETSTMQLLYRRIHGTRYGGGAHSGGAAAVKDPAY
ncbi:HNH endonuclease [uncultured Agrobacterium sp.]|uniref:HNH endonuclease n=1 Tax=uncultured Agrobacterium sp. TaxID=157277 RepID=UPI0025DA5C76|nr:HNH endonuclease [uncultured Agrobacterium sp.]